MNTSKKNKKVVKSLKEYKHHYMKKIGKTKRKYCQGSMWRGYNIIDMLFYTLFSEKYNTCIFDLSVHLSNDTTDVINQKLYTCVSKIKKCLTNNKKNTDIILIPFAFDTNIDGHRNLLIFRKTMNPPMLEWFEPHGSCFNLNPADLVSIQISEIIEKFIEFLRNELKLNIKLIKPDMICPEMGVQSIEEKCDTIPNNASGGYCALWTMFFLENVLKFKHMTTTELNMSLLEKNNTPEILRKLMLSYSNYLSKQLYRQTNTKLNRLIEALENNTQVDMKCVRLTEKIDEKIEKNKKLMTLPIKKSLPEKQSYVKQIMNFFYPVPPPSSSSSSSSSLSSSSLFSKISSGTVYSLHDEDNHKSNHPKKKSSPPMDIEF